MWEKAWNYISGVAGPEVLISIILISIALVILAVMRRAYNRYIHRLGVGKDYGNPKARIGRTIYTVARYATVGLLLVTILGVNGIDLTAIAAAAGAAGIVLGFALQDFLNDMVMGMRIVTDGYFSVGQAVKIGDVEGVVMAISPQSTKIKDIRNDSVVTLSNRLLTKVEVLDPMADIDVPLSYDLSAREAERILCQAVEGIKLIEGVNNAEFMGTQAFGDSAIRYKVRLWCAPSRRYQTLREARRIIQDVLEENGQSIPYPQLDVHTR